MDAFALLCNLHGNGPLTLRRLRRAGIHSLEDVTSLPPEQLARVLAGPQSLALRFASEARELARRVATEPLESEDEPVAMAPARVPARALTTTVSTPERASAVLPFEAVPAPAPETTPAPQPPAPDLNLARDDSLLAPGLLEGLDRALCERLVAQGVRTLETLNAMTELSFARAVGIPYTKLIELQYQARCRGRDIIVPAAPPPSQHGIFPRIPSLRAGPSVQGAPKKPHTSEVSGPFV